MKDEIETVQQAIGTLIRHALGIMNREMSYPGADPDRTDDAIREQKARIAVLRTLREQFENEMARSI